MQRGFTLVELAIVLVIIGLLVGGVLVGQDLIKSAAINATVSDIQSYQAAALTFRDKYGAIPGDLRNDKAALAGLTVSATSPGTVGEGDGDGTLENGSNTAPTVYSGLGGENTLFWRQLSDAGLIPFTSTATGATINTSSFATASVATLTGLIPQLRIRSTGFIHAYGLLNVNYYCISSFANNGNGAGSLYTPVVLSAREAQGIDQKMDDGFPATGVVLSAADGSNLGTAAPNNGGTGGSAPSTSNTICYDNTTAAGVYATSTDALANTIRCVLRIRAGF